MFGPPGDVEGQCNAHLYIADDYGDNHGTMRCQLKKGHLGLHQEIFDRGTVTWEKDERRCEREYHYDLAGAAMTSNCHLPYEHASPHETSVYIDGEFNREGVQWED